MVLSYMGLQSIRQEQNRQEEGYIKNLENSLAIAMSRIESEMEDRLQSIMNNLPVYGSMSGRSFYTQLRQMISLATIIEEAFMLDANLHVHYPRRFMEDRTFRPRFSYHDEPSFKEGVTFEARGMLDEAVIQYRRGLQESGSVIYSLALMNGIARCHFKMDQLYEARLSFRQIIDLDRGRFLGGEVPFVLLAYYQLAEIESRLGSPAESLNIILDFYELLVENFQYLRSAQYSFYISGAIERIEGLLALGSPLQTSRFQNISEQEKTSQYERSFRIFFDHFLLPLCRNYLQLPFAGSNLNYFRLQAGEDPLIVVLKMITDESHQAKGIKGLILNEDEMKRALISAVESHKLYDDINILLLNPVENGNELSTDDEDLQLLTAGFNEIQNLFPGYLLAVNLGDNPALENIYKGTIRLYYSLFVAIIGVILFGIVFIFRDIRRERQLSQLKSSFISNVSHEIKTPITTIRVLAGNLAEGLIIQQERQNAYFKLINREAEKLSYLTENILDFSSLEAQRKVYRKEFINLHEILRKVLRRFYLMHQKDDYKIHDTIPSELPDILASPDGIEQAVLNLLDNAVKYSGENKDIWLNLEQNNMKAVISVEDKGIGIALCEQEKIFDKFYRVENKAQRIPGSGIGLSLVREIAEMHNGSIQIESEPGKGSKFSLIIPIDHAKDSID